MCLNYSMVNVPTHVRRLAVDSTRPGTLHRQLAGGPRSQICSHPPFLPSSQLTVSGVAAATDENYILKGKDPDTDLLDSKLISKATWGLGR